MISVMSSAASFRTEKDLLGVLEVPAQAYYGIQTLRAVNNFRLSGVPISHYPKLVVGLAMVKQAAADANRELGHLSDAKHAAISEACARLIRGDFHEEFVVDMIQGGAGTSTNMNANEVIANIALEAMGHQKGEYQYLHPNNDVNMAQSTNDAYPTAIRLGLLLGHDALLASLDSLIQSFAAKGVEFNHVLKMGRTQLQDAVPMTLGQEFRAFATTLSEDLARTCQVFAQGSGEGAEFLAEGHRHGVLQLGTAHFQDVVELYTLGGERLDQAVEAGQQRVVTQQQAQTDRRRVGVVGRLRHVHVVVRVQVLVFALLVTHGLQRDVGDDFVGIHVGRSASAALNHVYHELFVEIAADQTCTGFADGCVLGFAQMTQLAVGVSGGLFNHGQADNQLRVVRNRDAGETEVVHRSQGLDAVIRLSGYFEYAKQVFFCAERCSGGHDRNHLDMDPVCAGTLQMLGL